MPLVTKQKIFQIEMIVKQATVNLVVLLSFVFML